MSVKDPFEQLVDEITLIRHDVASLQRSSIDRDEARHLHDTVLGALEEMRVAAAEVPIRIEQELGRTRAGIAQDAARAAESAAERGLAKMQAEVAKAHDGLSRAAQGVQRLFSRYALDFWAAMALAVAVGAVVGILLGMWVPALRGTYQFNPARYCAAAGGERGTNEHGSAYCVFWLDR